ncbi:MAG: CocE/NonD family hydrolase [Woeseiaceae bacterium]
MRKKIKEIHHDLIPLPDGDRLAFRAWMPADADQHPVPAILEFLPYRKNDGTVYRDEITMPATAEKGYACIRVDIRGTGESEGLFDDEYSEQELSDAEDVIQWLSQQRWCDGNVGMVGISWGGFNALQVAYRQPPALKAIITICSTDDRFNEDIHFAGGCLLNDNLDWAAFFWSYAQARCPDPRLLGDDWKQQWIRRLEHMPFLADKWIAEQRKTSYWKHGSVSEDYSRIKIPVYAMGGWADAYRNTVFRLLENLSCPRKGLIGPWAHKYPNIAYPDPKIDYVNESVRWWDRWLKNIQNDVMDEPQLHYYLMESVLPKVDYEHRKGRWQSEVSWPSAAIEQRRFYLHPGTLSAVQSKAQPVARVSSPETTGKMAGKLMVGIGHRGEFPDEQSPDDELSLTFDTMPLEETLNIVGQAALRLSLSSDQAISNLAARLCDVHPGGESTLITYGVLNLAHRDSNEYPQALTPGEVYEFEMKLNHIAYRLPEHHRLRLSISNAYWPLIWPSPYRDTLTINLSASTLSLPVKPVLETVNNPALEHFDSDSLRDEKVLRAPETRKHLEEDSETGYLNIRTRVDFGHYFYSSCETEIDFTTDQLLSIHPKEPTSAKSTSWQNVTMQQGLIRTSLESRYEMTCTENHYFIKSVWRAWEDEDCIFEKEFDHKIKRNLI